MSACFDIKMIKAEDIICRLGSSISLALKKNITSLICFFLRDLSHNCAETVPTRIKHLLSTEMEVTGFTCIHRYGI